MCASGRGSRRAPYDNIYGEAGISLRNLALQMADDDFEYEPVGKPARKGRATKSLGRPPKVKPPTEFVEWDEEVEAERWCVLSLLRFACSVGVAIHSRPLLRLSCLRTLLIA